MSDQNIGKELTVQLIMAKTKSNNLDAIKNLNLWGNELEDLAVLDKMPNLEVISLSVNRISSLRDFRNCHRLQELYLRKNCIADIREIRYLMKLPHLKVLWLHDNPCAQTENYRQIVIKHLPNLVKLDNNAVTQQQRNLSHGVKFSLSPFAQEQQKYQQPKNTKGKTQQEQPCISLPTREHYPQRQQQQQQKHSNSQYQKRRSNETPVQMQRNKNILMAVLSLMRELDPNSLMIVRKQAQNLSNSNKY